LTVVSIKTKADAPVTTDAPAATAPADPLAALLARKDQLEQELGRYQKVYNARDAASARLTQLDAEQAAIDESERSNWRAWSQNPTVRRRRLA